MASVVGGADQAHLCDSHPIDRHSTSSRPTTPERARRDKAAELDAYIFQIAQRFSFQLDRNEWTPSIRTQRSQESACTDCIRLLWWKERAALRECIETFGNQQPADRTISRLCTDLQAVRTLVLKSLSPKKRQTDDDAVDTTFVASNDPGANTALRSDSFGQACFSHSFDTSAFVATVNAQPNPFVNISFDAQALKKSSAEEFKRPNKRAAKTPPLIPRSAITSFDTSVAPTDDSTPAASFESIFSHTEQTKSAETSFTDISIIDTSFRRDTNCM